MNEIEMAIFDVNRFFMEYKDGNAERFYDFKDSIKALEIAIKNFEENEV